MGDILTVENDGHYQIIGEVSSQAEALELAHNYLRYPCDDNLAPERFVVHMRGPRGWYTERETLDV